MLVSSLWYLTGCSSPTVSSAEQIRRFEQAGPAMFPADTGGSAKTKAEYIYRVVIGDVLELQMPAILREISSDSSDYIGKVEPHLCRVNNAGTITLPIAGKIQVAGKTPSEVESAVVDTYYPRYVKNIPAVVCKVTEHASEKIFAVLGLVKRPEAFPYPPNIQYSLMEALALAGGVDQVANPRYVNVFRQQENGQTVSAPFRIDQDFMADAYKIVIKPGDVVYVKKTARTSMNTFFADTLRLNVGAYVRPLDD